MLPHLGTTTDLVDDELCTSCHDHDSFNSDHNNDCDICHAEGYTAPSTAICIQCHPIDDPGECNLVDFHEGFGTDCLLCHPECKEVPDTTTTTTIPADSTTTTVATQPCPTEEIYGENSEEVEILRYFRDYTLSTTPEGQEMIRLYYQWSPAIVRIMEEDEDFKKEVKGMVDEILPLIDETVE